MARSRSKQGATNSYVVRILNELTYVYQVIVTSYLFPGGVFRLERLESLSTAIGKDNLVVDVR